MTIEKLEQLRADVHLQSLAPAGWINSDDCDIIIKLIDAEIEKQKAGIPEHQWPLLPMTNPPRMGHCKCGNLVRSTGRFCEKCGCHIDWA